MPKYEYITEGSTYQEDAVAFESRWQPHQSQYTAEDAAEHCYDDDPDPAEFPLTLEIFYKGKSLGSFEVSLNFEPSFSSTKV